jgi:branched-chain amino acid transport system substrate-binding protein
MTFNRRGFLMAGAAFAAGLPIAAFPVRKSFGQSPAIIKIGVITDLSGVYRDVQGPGSVACAKLAASEFMQQNPDIKVEVISSDHQNKADIGVGIIREWFDRQGVDVITDVGNSAVAAGARTLLEGKDKVAIVTSAGSSDLTGKGCSPHLLHWGWDTWCLSHSTAIAMTNLGNKKWFFVTVDYSLGKILQADATRFIEAAGGQVVGSVAHPIGTSDFSSFLLQAQAAKPDVIAFANGGSDLIGAVKQAQEFGIEDAGIKLASMGGFINDIVGMGLPAAKGLSLTETFYWDLNDRTRAFAKRLQPVAPEGLLPNMNHTGNYSGVVHYLKAVKELGVQRAKASGREVVQLMKKMPTDDDCFGVGSIRDDGRKIHPAYLFTVKSPAESKYRGDIFALRSTIVAESAFRPIDQGGCSLVKM